ncbi:HNH endonuclease signature motif containing protein [Sporichthya sp.]|uniref:HNH endonuclease signature motif containing protein n=1 Tax=Sporichthya sp. TaxID=65475 RepID=UPI00182369AA|nr:HNH endonuclease signature motif containing protein [Sporichthya sp.]MBA3745181.1 DUF222 domain-containing protein [Sporichthya sp.]
MSVQAVSAAAERSVPDSTGATSTRAWLTQLLHITPRAAKERVRLAAGFKDGYSEIGAALGEARINYAQASAIHATVEALPKIATTEQKDAAQAYLLEHASHLHGDDLRKLGKVIDAMIDPDGVEPREEGAKGRRGLNIRNHHDGTQTIAWRETDENIALVKAAMSALSVPVPAVDGARDARVPGLRRADAMMEIVAQALRKGRLPRARGERPHLVITASIDALRTGQGFGVTGSGESLSAQAVRRLACDAEVFGVVMDRWRAPRRWAGASAPSPPPNGSRSAPATSAAPVKFLWPGCTRPSEFCVAHHLRPWLDLGPTDLDNLALLCAHHHDAVHHKGWDIFLGEDRHPRLRPQPGSTRSAP